MAGVSSALAIVLMVGAAAGISAQPADPGIAEKMAQRQTERMKNDLELTAVQVPRVLQINQAESSDFQRMMRKYRNAGADKRALVEEALAIGMTRDSQLQQILSPEQWRTYQASKPERTAEGMTRIMTAQLGLSDEQIPRVEQINLVATRRMQAEMGGSFQEKSKRQKSKVARALRSIGEERDHSLVQVLTGEQWGTYAQNKEEMRQIMQEKLAVRTP